ncbi:unnamed protein product [Moneuplotes crassus]|uniref:Uncharacterized protein n=1 Tax=Euplotes crassus TaxID=5936 RepID=A0AAD1U078_EUPCR|nr:unnamed protein product [Moneuplotes crassus]
MSSPNSFPTPPSKSTNPKTPFPNPHFPPQNPKYEQTATHKKPNKAETLQQVTGILAEIGLDLTTELKKVVIEEVDKFATGKIDSKASEKRLNESQKMGNDTDEAKKREAELKRLVSQDVQANMPQNRLKFQKESLYKEMRQESERIIQQNKLSPLKNSSSAYQESQENSGLPPESLYSSSNGRIVLAAQQAIDLAKKNLEDTSTLHKKQIKLYKKLIQAQNQKVNDWYKRKTRKSKHIDIIGIIDNQPRIDGVIKDYYHGRTMFSKTVKMENSSNKNKGGFWKLANFTEDEFNELYNLTVLTQPENEGNHLEMRLIRNRNGRGMGDAFLERRNKIYNQQNLDTNTVTIIREVVVNHYEESPDLRRFLPRPSNFRAYQQHSQSFLMEVFQNSDSRKTESGSISNQMRFTETQRLPRQRHTANHLRPSEESKAGVNQPNLPFSRSPTNKIEEESMITSSASSISASNVPEDSEVLDYSGRKGRKHRNRRSAKPEKKYKLQLMVDIQPIIPELDEGFPDDDGWASDPGEEDIDITYF